MRRADRSPPRSPPREPPRELRFARRTFSRTILPLSSDDAHLRVPLDLVWQAAVLHVCDSIGGSTRSVTVEVAWAADRTFLRSVEPLHKSEFEQLFGFGCGRFVRGRVVHFASDVLT